MGTNGPLNAAGASGEARTSSSNSGSRHPPEGTTSSRGRTRSTNTTHPPVIDPWCDDGSISRVEPPWLRDKRMKQQRDRLHQQKERLSSRSNSKSPHNNNPFEEHPPLSPASTNPFDSSSVSNSYGESAEDSSRQNSPQQQQQQQQQHPPPPLLYNSAATSRPVTPLEEKKESDAAVHMRQATRWDQVPPYQQQSRPGRTKHVNPFDSDSSTNPSQQQPQDDDNNYVNPFDTSGESSEDPISSHHPHPQRPRIVRPSTTRAVQRKNKHLGHGGADESVGGQDSLDRFLDTTDETAASSTAKDPITDDDDDDDDDDEEGQYRYLQQQPRGPYYVSGTTSSEGDSITSTPSVRALQAAQALKESFHRPNNSRPTTPMTPNSSNQQQGHVGMHNNNIVTPPTAAMRSSSSPDNYHHHHVTGSPSSSARSPGTATTPGESVRPLHTRRNLSSPTTSPVTPQQRLPRTPQDFPTLQSTAAKRQNHTNEDYQYGGQERMILPIPEDSEPPNDDEPNDTHLLGLHDLCDEARTTDDLAWRNALYLLSVQPELVISSVDPESQMNVLHVCCMALDVQQPCPVWMVRALLYTHSHQCQQEDAGGRLPLHLLAATSAHVQLMQLLVEEYPASVAHRDTRGFTPLQLLLKNDQIELTLEHLRILLGQTTTTNSAVRKKGRHISFRKGEHLQQSFQDLQELQTQQQEKHEQLFDDYPEDVQQCLRKITQWKRRQINRGLATALHTQNSNQLALVYDNPASIATPSTQQWPLHLLVRRKRRPRQSLEEDATIGSPNVASLETLIRVLIAADPQALLERDVHGRTPLLTALLQADSSLSPDDIEIVELLLGKYTPGICSSDQHSPVAQLASTDTLQLPLHVAAEEMAHNFELLSTIVEAYPLAVQVQDIRGRTPLHCALQNYRSVPVDEATFGLLLMSRNRNYEQVAKTLDADGKRPLDLIIEQPKSLKRWSSAMEDPQVMMNGEGDDDDDLLCAFVTASIDVPRNERQARNLMERIRTLPPWLRRAACASSHVQRILLEELASPMNTALVLLQGGTLVSLLIVLRIALEGSGIEFDSWVLVNYFCAYHLATQLLYWGTAYYLGEFYRMVLANGWRWIDLTAVCCSIGTAFVVQTDITSLRASLDTNVANFNNFVPADDDALISSLGAWATGFLWLSLVGFLVQWWCALAVFVGSAVQVTRALFWPIAVAGMGIVAMAQILNTLEDCVEGNICGLGDAYTTVYWLILGEPILGLGELSVFENETTTSMMVVLILFTLLWFLWLVSVITTAVSEAYRLDRHQIALQWFWEPKVALTVMARPTVKETLTEPRTWTRRYCDFMERLWHVLASSIRGGQQQQQQQKEQVYWYACCFRRPGAIVLTRLLACIVLPIWFWLGVATLGLLWPPQLRRWLFSTKVVVNNGRKGKGPTEERLTAAKLSHLKGEMEEYQQKSMDQSHAIQQDLAQIKDLLFRAMAEEGPVSGSW